MAGLRVFISSTCYDLSVVRSQLRVFIQSLGHEPFMSDYNDLLYDPRTHTHTSCVDEVNSADVVILILGSRFGGKVVPEALARIDFESLTKESNSIESLKKKENLSITQLEILKAVESGIPIYTFIDAGVWHDHSLYERNKDKPIISEISFPSIEKPHTATFIFEFINFLRHRTRGNSVHQFSKFQDIEDILRRQWSSLFQRLIQEQRTKAFEARRIDNLTDQFEDLKTAILTSISNTNERDVARGVVQYRRLIDFVKNLGLRDYSYLIKGEHSWDDFLKHVGIVEIIDLNEFPEIISSLRTSAIQRPRVLLIKEDRTFFELRMSVEFLNSISLDWDSFMKLNENTKGIIVDALSEMRPSMGSLRYIREPLEYFPSINIEKLLRERDIESDSEN
ncbi:DUF4062 domain-containing protein [Acinetobacter sp. ANC 3926]|uniref:DUF4062 domain-containing protein n=1 Tax=Acinetobacter genomosp. 15BJ TaxID=106651 RepID=UPI001F4B0BCC|nr:DUF4062 domain-containing protein [Acinetobacter genomosp. 15BJ]MCH7292306.1 DUF4062 domain-containing protein [Acinetobacter genomosp. 15BJ]